MRGEGVVVQWGPIGRNQLFGRFKQFVEFGKTFSSCAAASSPRSSCKRALSSMTSSLICLRATRPSSVKKCARVACLRRRRVAQRNLGSPCFQGAGEAGAFHAHAGTQLGARVPSFSMLRRAYPLRKSRCAQPCWSTGGQACSTPTQLKIDRV